MAKFDIHQLEERVGDLVAAYRHLQGENSTLKKDIASLKHTNADTRQRLQHVVERIVTLEKEAEAQQ